MVRSASCPNWVIPGPGLLLAASLMGGCGGVATSEDAAYDIVEGETEATTVTLSNDRTENQRQPGLDEVEPPVCDCPGDDPFNIVLLGDDTTSDLVFSQPPPAPERTGLWACGRMNYPAIHAEECDSDWTAFACHESEGCIALGVTSSTLTLERTTPAGDTVRSLQTLRSAGTVEFTHGETQASGTLAFVEAGRPISLVEFNVCKPASALACSR